jgi:hypothetical protein
MNFCFVFFLLLTIVAGFWCVCAVYVFIFFYRPREDDILMSSHTFRDISLSLICGPLGFSRKFRKKICEKHFCNKETVK